MGYNLQPVSWPPAYRLFLKTKFGGFMTDSQMPAPETAEENKLKGAFELTISSDGLSAHLSGAAPKDTERNALQAVLAQLIREKGLKHGVDSGRVKKALDQLVEGQTLEKMVLAQGTPPAPGQNARVEIVVQIYQGPQWCLSAKQAKLQPTQIKTGEPIASITPPKAGKAGIDVFGRPVEPDPPLDHKFQAGQGISRSGDNREVRAATGGVVLRSEPDKFEVLEILDLEYDPEQETGDIEFPGLVRIPGPISGKSAVKARVLEAKELGKGTKARITDHLFISGGCLGSDISVGRDMRAHYIRNCRVSCGGNLVLASEVVKSTIQCMGSVIIKNRDGRIANSHVSALKGVAAHDVETTEKSGTIIDIGPREEFEHEFYGLRKKAKTLAHEAAMISEAVLAQQEELVSTEQEMKDILALLKDPAQGGNRENLLSQLEMIKPLRQTLKEGVQSGQDKSRRALQERQRILARLAVMEPLIRPGAAKLVVRGETEAGIEIIGPHSSLLVKKKQKSSVFFEVKKKTHQEGEPAYEIKTLPLPDDLK